MGLAHQQDATGEKRWIRLALRNDRQTAGFDAEAILLRGKEGQLIHLSQLVQVKHQEEAPQSYYRINGLNSIYLSLQAEETANQLRLAKQVKEEMAQIRALLPSGYEMHVSYDATEYIEEELHKIFHRFYRGSNAKEMAKEGAGVGLYLARSIIEQQGGTILAKRKTGCGTIFKIMLPI